MEVSWIQEIGRESFYEQVSENFPSIFLSKGCKHLRE
jgi:hypothetical protein